MSEQYQLRARLCSCSTPAGVHRALLPDLHSAVLGRPPNQATAAPANSARLKAIRRPVRRHIRLLTDRSTPGNPEQDVPFCPQ
ncbi:MAG: hypothetical protein WBM63_17020, partial [Sedimenticolaceae bacterium]